MDVYRNGSLVTGLLFTKDQLGSLSLAMAAIDASIGMGSMTVQGNPGWIAGDRITWAEDALIFYTGFVMDQQTERAGEPTEMQTTYQLMDVNRQLIGRRTVDWGQDVITAAGDRMSEFVTQRLTDGALPQPVSLDLTFADFSDTTPMPPRRYTGDGIMDVLADYIKYTGKTVFLTPTQTEGTYYLHVHALASGGGSISLTDVPSDVDNVTTLPIRAPRKVLSATDLKNVVEGRNGVITVSGDNAPSVAAHEVGGLAFEAVLTYSENADTLALIVNNMLNATTGQGDEKPTYSCGATFLTTTQAQALSAGQLVVLTSEVLGLTSSIQRIAHVTFTITKDASGNPLPGYWDAALETGNPIRLPSATLGLGAAGGDSGRLSDPLQVHHVTVQYDDPDIPVGSTTTVTGQLMTDKEIGVAIPDVTVTWTLVQWEDEAMTVAGSDYSIDPATSDTDISGLATTEVTHDTLGDTIMWWVEADT